VAHHPDIEGFFEGLANRGSRQLLVQRVMSVLGMGEVLQSQAEWTVSEGLHPLVRGAVRKIGVVPGAKAKTTYELVTSSFGAV